MPFIAAPMWEGAAGDGAEEVGGAEEHRLLGGDPDHRRVGEELADHGGARAAAHHDRDGTASAASASTNWRRP